MALKRIGNLIFVCAAFIMFVMLVLYVASVAGSVPFPAIGGVDAYKETVVVEFSVLSEQELQVLMAKSYQPFPKRSLEGPESPLPQKPWKIVTAFGTLYGEVWQPVKYPFL